MLIRTLFTAALFLVVPLTAIAQEKVTVKILNGGRVYHPRNLVTGSSHECVKPALCDVRRILDATPEYIKIRDEGIRRDSAEHRILRQAASDRFKAALQRAMSQKGYDLVAETGAITVEGRELPDVTDEVIQNL